MPPQSRPLPRDTFVVAARLILVLGGLSARQARTDIFPEIDLSVVTVIWTYRGVDATEFEKRIITYSEYSISSNVNNIRRMESQTVNGVGIIRIHFHPGTDVNASLGYTLNVMTLGGLALAVGILVDDATVEIENVHRNIAMKRFAFVVGGVLFTATRVGEDFFPSVDAGQFRLHVRAPAGTRIEQTERYFTQVGDEIRNCDSSVGLWIAGAGCD